MLLLAILIALSHHRACRILSALTATTQDQHEDMEFLA